MVTKSEWLKLLLSSAPPEQVWQSLFDRLKELSTSGFTGDELHRATVPADRLLAHSAWELWQAFESHAPLAVDALKQFWAKPTPGGKAVLILDALSLRELPHILKAGEKRGIAPVETRVLGSPVPSDTTRFACACGVAQRSVLENDNAPSGFIFHGQDTYTDVVSLPFADCSASPKRNLFIWHSWLDERIHTLKAEATGSTLLAREAKEAFSSDAFWSWVEALRQGRDLVITSDHGYAVSRLFSDQETDPELPKNFGQKRFVQDNAQWQPRHLSPIALACNGFLVVMGQRRWTVQGGFPHLCHGGLSLLEAAVPWIQYAAK